MNNPVCILDEDIDIYLSMSWEPGRPHGICGHVYEIIDYYLLLHHHFRVGILFGDTFSEWSEFSKCIEDKYRLSSSELQSFKDNTKFHHLPMYVKGTNILFVDGSLRRLQTLGVRLMFKNILVFKCSYLDTIYDKVYENVTLLQDDRVYIDITPEDVDISVNYIKKINFKHYKELDTNIGDDDTSLIYATTNCRYLHVDNLKSLFDLYKAKKYLIVTNKPSIYNVLSSPRVTILKPPVNGLFDMFSTYIYTPTECMWDGSPRFPAECKHYDKNVIYHDITDKYMSHDRGLYYRRLDISNNFNSLALRDDDEIIDILNEKILYN